MKIIEIISAVLLTCGVFSENIESNTEWNKYKVLFNKAYTNLAEETKRYKDIFFKLNSSLNFNINF